MTNDTKNSPNSRLFGCDKAVAQTIAALISCYQRQGKLLVCGNGVLTSRYPLSQPPPTAQLSINLVLPSQAATNSLLSVLASEDVAR